MSRPGQTEPIRADAAAVMRAELRQIRDLGLYDDPHLARKLAEPLSALCFSGGGIRSAAFNLGVARALARARLLGKFDYLSTVSGGGYIGGWLQVLIKEQEAVSHAEKVELAQFALNEHEVGALDRLRNNANFLAPQMGLGSPDTWAGVVLYLRNLVLNWIVLLPVLLLAVLAPVFHRTLIWQAGLADWASIALPLAGWVALCCAVWQSCRSLPSHLPAGTRSQPVSGHRAVIWIVSCVLFWALMAPIIVQHFAIKSPADFIQVGGYPPLFHSSTIPPPWAWAVFPVAHLSAMIIGYTAAGIWPRREDPVPGLFWRNAGSWLVASLGTSAVAGALMFGEVMPMLPLADGDATWNTLLGPLAVVVMALLQSSFFVGLRKEALYADLDREWLGRLDGLILAGALAWTLFAFCCVMLGSMIIGNWTTETKGLATAGAGAVGGLGAWVAKQAKSWLRTQSQDAAIMARVYALVPTILAAAFVLLLLGLLGWKLQEVMGDTLTSFMALLPPEPAILRDKDYPRLAAGWLNLLAQAVLALLLAGLIHWLGRTNINRYSMHTVYRNRLVRAFLGTARTPRDPATRWNPSARRDPEWFTDQDPNDNLTMAELIHPGGGQKLFPVVNLTINLSVSERTAWAERKGASFTATPLHCGSEALGPRGYVRTAHYGGGTAPGADGVERGGARFGSMITTSGAAASPHWGYHTSPLVAFLMTLFNVRLGLWLPNPARVKDHELQSSRPPNAIRALLGDLIGRTSVKNQAIYLSDGGHFENLGLYEMLRRRCRWIVVVDAGEDPECRFFDLGSVIRKAEIDMPVRVTMEPMRVLSRGDVEKDPKIAAGALGIAVGRIDYFEPTESDPNATPADAELDAWRNQTTSGSLIYIKPSYLADLPAAVRTYGAENKDFPHQSTLDQFFSESQFESYHVLGYYQMHKLTADCARGELESLFTVAAEHCRVRG